MNSSRNNFNGNISQISKKGNPLKRPLNFKKEGQSQQEIAFTKDLLFKKDENLMDIGDRFNSRRDENKKRMLTLNNTKNRSQSNVKISFNNTTNTSAKPITNPSTRPPMVTNKISIPRKGNSRSRRDISVERKNMSVTDQFPKRAERNQCKDEG